MTASLSPTARTRLARNRERGATERAALHDLLEAGLIAHLGVLFDGVPRVLPTAYAHDVDGPDDEGTLYIHGSVASKSLTDAPTQTVCVTITLVDGLVLARSGFHHSMNYRSAVILGQPRQVDDASERDHALDLIVDHLAPGRSKTLRAHTRKELVATTVLALPLREASVKSRTGGVNDEPFDVEAGDIWAGVVPMAMAYGAPERNDDCSAALDVPDHVRALTDASPL